MVSWVGMTRRVVEVQHMVYYYYMEIRGKQTLAAKW